ncbi:bacitracin ABC transporter ATP-binding protein [Alteribacter lacisalsi]|uniref:Bacitracin ABC transporter ATP-binding protein n=1 Tax=Alteribacter lacisalsi TaxID=2045244 RepID=A0A2W0HMQ0_9BACI|nr:ABC transporter ATP-binding protein [Alteribacter lacisalsi]PYZ98159.1 bacitracin ABC transporter ATP-binding protein [Alteribacter lacisalsi]
MEKSVILKGLTKRIGNREIVKNVNLDIYRGEVFGLLGPNGAGKTTIIRMMTGLVKPSDGEVTISGYPVGSEFEKAIARTGAVVENPEMYGFMSGLDNLVHYARMHKGISNEQINEIVKVVELEERIKDKVKTYSLGMRQRLGLAQSLLHSPEVLILDEPTNGLDPAGIREMREYLKRLAKEENICVIVSSHLLSEMEKMCDRVAVIHKGECIRIEALSELAAGKKESWFISIEGNPETAAAILKGWAVQTDKNGIVVKTNRKNIPDCLKLLIAGDVPVFEVRPETSGTLEEEFLSITGGSTA